MGIKPRLVLCACRVSIRIFEMVYKNRLIHILYKVCVAETSKKCHSHITECVSNEDCNVLETCLDGKCTYDGKQIWS